MKKIIIVTGGAGFIGSNLIEKLLLETNNNIVSLDNYSSGSTYNHIINKRITYIKGDTKDFKKIFNKIKNKIKIIFHFGEFSRIVESFNKIEKIYESNILGSFAVIKFCLDNEIKIIYSATSASFGNNLNDQHLSPYAFTKNKNLELIINFHKWYNLKYEIIYFFNVYGPKQITNHVMAAVIGIFEYNKKNNLKLPVVMPGTQKRHFTHVVDTVDACILAMKKNKNAQYAISYKKSYRILEVAKLFRHKFKFVPRRKGERFESKKILKFHGQRINQLNAKINLKNYIENLYNFNKKS
jgi:UDP-glucose 4-epimerase